MGRKKYPRVVVYVSVEERAVWERAAARDRLGISTWLRSKAMGAAASGSVPQGGPSGPHTARLLVNVEWADEQEWQAAAKRAGVSLTEWLRRVGWTAARAEAA